MGEKFYSSNLNQDTYCYAGQYPEQMVSAMQALAPSFGLTLKIVGQPGDRVSDYDLTMRRPPRHWSVSKGNLAVRVIGPSTQDSTPFYDAVRAELEQQSGK